MIHPTGMGARTWLYLGLTLLGVLPGASALAQGPAEGEGQGILQEPGGLPEPAPDPPEGGDEEGHAELGGLPAVAGNDTFGVLVGATGSYTYFQPGFTPFRYRLQLFAVTSFKRTDGRLRLPLQDVDLRLDMPGLASGNLRLFALVRYLRTQEVGYWGVGNGASGRIPDDYTGSSDLFFTYEKQAFEVRTFLRGRIVRDLEWVAGFGLRVVFPVVLADSHLDRDLAAGGRAAQLLYGYTRHTLVDGLVGLLYDSRDDEFNPSRGAYHELSLRTGGGPSNDRALRYGSAFLHARGFIPLLGERLVFAVRGLVDVGFGRVPLVELGTLGGYVSVSGPGSIEANRGLPFGRQLGQVKLLGTVELRSTFYGFSAFGQDFKLAAAGFVDASRVWAEVRRGGELGGGPFLRFSFGAGPRIVWGRGLVIRIDLAVSPGSDIDGRTNIAGGLGLGHIF